MHSLLCCFKYREKIYVKSLIHTFKRSNIKVFSKKHSVIINCLNTNIYENQTTFIFGSIGRNGFENLENEMEMEAAERNS